MRQRQGAKFVVSRVDLSTGQRTKLFEHIPDSYGISAVVPIAITADGKSYAYTYAIHNDLFIVTGLI